VEFRHSSSCRVGFVICNCTHGQPEKMECQEMRGGTATGSQFFLPLYLERKFENYLRPVYLH
jgi:hypothetical protein